MNNSQEKFPEKEVVWPPKVVTDAVEITEQAKTKIVKASEAAAGIISTLPETLADKTVEISNDAKIRARQLSETVTDKSAELSSTIKNKSAGFFKSAVSNAVSFFKQTMNNSITGVHSLGKKLQKASDEISHGRMAAVGLPLSIMLRSGTEALERLEKKPNEQGISQDILPSVGGTIGLATGAAVATAVIAPASVLGVIGVGIVAVATAAVAPAAIVGAWALVHNVKSLPKAIINIPTGIRRSLDAVKTAGQQAYAAGPEAKTEQPAAPQTATTTLQDGVVTSDFTKNAAAPVAATAEDKPQNVPAPAPKADQPKI